MKTPRKGVEKQGKTVLVITDRVDKIFLSALRGRFCFDGFSGLSV